MRRDSHPPCGRSATSGASQAGRGIRPHPIEPEMLPADDDGCGDEHVVERLQRRIDGMPQAGRLRRQTVEHTFGTLKSWMGATHFLTRTLPKVRTEMSLQVLAYNLKRVMQILGVQPLIAAMRA